MRLAAVEIVAFKRRRAAVTAAGRHLEPLPDRVECLSCGRVRPPQTSAPECPFCGYLGWAHASNLTPADRAWYGALTPPAVAIVWRGEMAGLSQLDVRVLMQSLRIADAPEAQNLADRLEMALAATTEVDVPLFEPDLDELREALADLAKRGLDSPGTAALIRLVAPD
jgi:hypothetical protein